VGSSTDLVKPKTIKLVFVASPLSTQRLGKRVSLVAELALNNNHLLTLNSDNLTNHSITCIKQHAGLQNFWFSYL
jgi:hypothetical protein